MNSTMLFVLEARTWSVFVLIVGLGGALLRAHTVLEMVHFDGRTVGGAPSAICSAIASTSRL